MKSVNKKAIQQTSCEGKGEELWKYEMMKNTVHEADRTAGNWLG